jgi:hypothetical protein
MHHWQVALAPRLADLVVEVRQREILPVVLVEARIVVPCRDEAHAIRAAVVHGREAHRARVSEDVELAACEGLGLELQCGRRYLPAKKSEQLSLCPECRQRSIDPITAGKARGKGLLALLATAALFG